MLSCGCDDFGDQFFADKWPRGIMDQDVFDVTGHRKQAAMGRRLPCLAANDGKAEVRLMLLCYRN